MPDPSKIVPFVLRMGAIVVFVWAQIRAKPTLGLTGTSLTVTALTSAIVIILLVVQLPLARKTSTPRQDHKAPRPSPPQPRPDRAVSQHPPGRAPSRPPQDQEMPRPPLDHAASRPSEPVGASRKGVQFGVLVRAITSRVSRITIATRRSVRAIASRASAATSTSRVPVMAVALGLSVALAIILDAVVDGGPALAVLLYCLGIAAVRLPLRHSAPIGVLAIGGLLVEGAIYGRLGRDLSLILSACLVFLVAYSVKERRAARAAEAREAVLAERARIAREIHDILAHSLSAQLVHLEGAKLLLRADKTDEALDRVVRARDLAKSGLEEARRAVSALREDSPALPQALRTLAEDFQATTNRACTLHISGAQHRLPPETELALLRTAQEALTNVRRHAPGSPATVRLVYEPGSCDLRVTNPASAEPGTPGGGYGLMGMRERAELLGGTLSAGETTDGFRVHLRIPA